MFGLGCVFAQLCVGNQLFNARNEHEILCRWSEVLGDMPAELAALGASKRPEIFYWNGTRYLLKMIEGMEGENNLSVSQICSLLQRIDRSRNGLSLEIPRNPE
jgi:hypothetical protein